MDIDAMAARCSEVLAEHALDGDGPAHGAMRAALEAIGLPELLAKAARYDWLRGQDGTTDAGASVTYNIGHDWIEMHGDELDAAIDANLVPVEEGDA